MKLRTNSYLILFSPLRKWAMPSLSFLLILISFAGNAGIVEDYEAERSRILRLNYYQIHDELQKTNAFDLNTPLGKHFYNTIVRVSHQFDAELAFSDDELKILKSSFPKFAIEHQISEITTSDLNAKEKIHHLEQLSEVALKFKWDRIYRYAVGQLVRYELEDYQVSSALIRMLLIVDQAPVYKVVEMTFDYPLQSVYLDLANAFYQIGESEKAIPYCEMAGDFLPKSSQSFHIVTRCKVDALAQLERYKEAFQLISASIERARSNGEKNWLSNGYLYAANIAIHMNKFTLAENYIVDAINIQKANGYNGESGYFYEYLKLAQLNIKQKNVTQAKEFIKMSEDASRDTYQSLSWRPTFLLVHADISELEGNYKDAISYHKAAIESVTSTPQKIPFDTLNSLINKLHEKQIENFNSDESLQIESHTKIFVLAFILLSLAVLVWILLIRKYRMNFQLEIYKKFDLPSGLLTRTYALESLKTHTKRNSNGTIVLLQFDSNDIEAFVKSFGGLVTQVRYQLGSKDIIGRYSGNTLIIYFNNMLADTAESKVAHLLSSTDLLQYGSFVEYRYAVTEFTGKLSLKDLLKSCENSLKAKKFISPD